MANLFAKAGMFALDKFVSKGKPTTKKPKQPWSPLAKLRIPLVFVTCLIGISLVLNFLLVFSGWNKNLLDDYAVFNLNVSRIGGEIHEDIDHKIDGISLDALHIDLKRSVPVFSPATVTAPPTTIITMAPRGLGSALESLTEKAGDGVESAKSAAHSKASEVQSEVQSKASSAANSVESGINSGIDSAEGKIKAELKQLVDTAFNDITSALDLKDFYSAHMMATCEGSYAENKGKGEGVHKQVEFCDKKSPLNPLFWVSFFYWAAIVTNGIAFVLCLMLVFRPTTGIIRWTNLALGTSFILLLVGSVLTHGIATAVQKLVSFVGDPISTEATAGRKFIATTWTSTFMILTAVLLLAIVSWRIKRHPEITGAAAPAPKSTWRPMISSPVHTQGAAYPMHDMPTQPAPTYGREFI